MKRFIALFLLFCATWLLVAGPLAAKGATTGLTEPTGQTGSIAVVGSAFGPAVVPRRPSEPNPVIVPPYRATVRAAHRVHAEQTQLSCNDCHIAATTSQKARDWLGPSATVCER